MILAKNKKSGEYFAMKRLKKADILKLHQTDHVISENTILADIEHPFLVSLELHEGDLGGSRRQTSSGKDDDLAYESRLPANGPCWVTADALAATRRSQRWLDLVTRCVDFLNYICFIF